MSQGSPPRPVWHPDWLLWGGTPFHDPKSSVQKQMATGLAALGSRVLYVEVMGPFREPRSIAVGEGRIHLFRSRRTPLLPMSAPGWNRKRNMTANMDPLRREVDRLGFSNFITLHYGWYSAELARGLGQKLDVLDCIDAEEERPKVLRVPGMKNYVINTERALLERIDGLVVTSPELVDERRLDGLPTAVLPNGINPNMFPPEAPEPGVLRDVPRPRAVLAGVLGSKIDLNLLAGVMDRLPHLHLVVLGPVLQRIPGRLKSGRVHFLGEVPHHGLGAHLMHCDVGVIPLTDTKYNRASCPLKALEYLASGLAVASVPNPVVHRLAGEHPGFFFVSGDRDCLGQLVLEALEAAGRPGFRDRARAAAAGHSWEDRARALLEFVRPLAGPGGR